MSNAAIACLDTWLKSRLKPEAIPWLSAQVVAIHGGDKIALSLAFSSAGRRVGHALLALDEKSCAEARRVHAGWTPERWRIDHAVRTRLALAMSDADAHHWLTNIERLFTTGSVEELVALYQALPVLPFPELLRDRAAEGVRSSMQAVFTAVALDNPYPSEQFDQDAFNQMVLKAFFLGVDIDRIRGLELRANADLTRMLLDYARERRAASRPIDPRLWRVVGLSADVAALTDLRQAISDGSEAEQTEATRILALLDESNA